MPRPIDADAPLNEINELKKSPWYNGENGNYERIIRAEAIGIVTDLCVKQAPTLDYEPVRHSKWKYYHKQNRAVCMACSFERNLDADFGAAVCCPNCGAKMDAKEDAHV